jgi:hypothetical protein
MMVFISFLNEQLIPLWEDYVPPLSLTPILIVCPFPASFLLDIVEL